MLNPFLNRYLPEMKRILRSHKVKRVYVFGSATTDSFSKTSDIDLLVAFEQGLDPVVYGTHFMDALYELEKLLGRNVDLVAEETVRNPCFRNSIDRTKIHIYG